MPGAAALPRPDALRRLQRFKGRRGPFLLLTADVRAALRLARRRPPSLRRMMREHWPGPVTLAFPARPGLPDACLRRGRVAVRVDAYAGVRCLCRLAGGLLVSTSLNRRGRPTEMPSRRLRWRWRRHLDGTLPAAGGFCGGGSAPSTVLEWRPGSVRKLRS